MAEPTLQELVDESAFWRKVDKRSATECWLWVGSRVKPAPSRLNYGVVNVAGGKKRGAHRVAWILTNGAIPDGMCVLHHCDNPPCCNPAHLWLGTIADNNRDRDEKNRQAKPPQQPPGGWPGRRRGEAHGRAILTENDVHRIRADSRRTVEMAAETGVSPRTILRIRNRESWGHVE